MKNKSEIISQRIKENYQKNRKLLLVFFVIWILAAGITLYSNRSTLGKQSYGNEYSQYVQEVFQGTEITQIMPIYEGSQNMAVKFATFARKNSGNVRIEVTGYDSGMNYADETVSIIRIQDNAYYSFPLKQVMNKKTDEKLIVQISSDSVEGKGVGVYYSDHRYFDDSSLMIDGSDIEGDLTIRYLFENKKFQAFSVGIITFTIIGISFLILLMLLLDPKYEVLFSVFIFVIGLVFMVIITPLSVPDEQAHYEAALQISNYVVSEDYHTFVEKEYISYSHYYGHYNVSAAYERLIEYFNDPLQLSGKKVEMSRDIDGIYTAYFVPQSVGVLIGRLLKLNMLKVFYLGRLTNLIFYCLMVYFAIRITPVGKLLFGILAGLPICMQVAASHSYDCFINAFCLLNLAVLSKWLYEEKTIGIKDFVLAFAICAFLAPAKYVYAFFAFLYFLVPYRRFGSRKMKLLAVVLLCVPAMYLLAPILLPRIKMALEALIRSQINVVEALTNTPGPDMEDGMPVFTEPYTLKYVFSHFKETLILIAFTIRYNIKLWFYGAIGRYLSGMSLILPLGLTYLIIAIVLSSSFRKEEYVPSISTRLAFLFVCILMGLLTVGGMLLYWTNVGDYYIQGVQGRYFVPLIPYFFSVFNNRKIRIPERFDKYILFSYLMMMFEVIIYVLSYTFVN